MNKTINYTATLIAAILFSGAAAAANGEQAEDILHGNGAVTASMGAPYVQADGDRDNRDDLLSNLQEIHPSAGSFTPYVQVGGDQDNRDDLLNQVS